MIIQKQLLFIGLLFVLLATTKAQSVYSFEGIGTLNRPELPQNFAKGGVGIGTPSFLKINVINPANLSYNVLSSFQVALNMSSYNYKTTDFSENRVNGGLSALAYAFPVVFKKWSSSVGILPYSTVKYNTFSEGEVNGTSSKQSSVDRGEGGLNSFYWGNGFTILKKVNVGVKVNYIFGTITKSSTKYISDENLSVLPSKFENKQKYSGFQYTLGASYKQKLSKNNYLNFGVIYAPQTNLGITGKLSLFKGDKNFPSTRVSSEESKSKFKLPENLGFGISFEKMNVFSIGVDFEKQNWSSLSDNKTKFNDLMQISVGTSWVPDYDNLNSVFYRSTYMLGFVYKTSPYVVKNTSLTDFGINFGASIPVNAYSSLDLGFKLGQTGTSSNGLVRENYFKVLFGATINDRWFIRRKYD